MSEVLNLDDYRPHCVHDVQCPECLKGWLAVCLASVSSLECPGCGGMVEVDSCES